MPNLKVLKKIPSQLSRDGIFLFIGIIVFIIVFSFIALTKYYNFGYNGLDLAIINQSFYLTLNGDIFGSTIHPPSYWADHFSPIILLLIPFYWLWPEAITLLLMQVIIVALCAIPLYLIAKKVFEKTFWPLMIAMLWLTNPFVHNITLFEFHLLGFGAFAILWMFYFYQNNKWWAFVITGFLALLVREDLSLVVVSFGILSLLDKKSLKWIIVPIVSAAIYFLLSLNLINHVSLDGGYKFLLYYSWLGASLKEIIFNAITKPWLIMFKIISPGSLLIFFILLLPLALAPLLRPRYLILSSLIFIQLVSATAWKFLGIVLVTQYSSLLLPGVFISCVYGISKIIEKKNNRFILYKQPHFLILVLATSVVSALFFGPIPHLFANLNYSQLDLLAKKNILTSVPKTASVASSYDSLTSLSSRRQIASLNYVFIEKLQFGFLDYQMPNNTDYILLNTQDYLSYVIQFKNNHLYAADLATAITNWPSKFDNYGLVTTFDNWALFKKNHQSTEKLVDLVNDYPSLDIENKTLLLDVNFLGINQKQNGAVELWWEKPAEVRPTTVLFINFIKNKKIISSATLPLGYGLAINSDKQFFSMLYQPLASTGENYDSIELKLAEIEKGYIRIVGDRGLKPLFQYSTTSPQLVILLNE